MWHEARKQEKSIRGSLVDLKKRADRRKSYYSTIKEDPIKFLRCYGRPLKIHLDAETVKAAENPNNLPSTFEKIEERLCNYERYRALVKNDFSGLHETVCLRQIEWEERYGDSDEVKRKELVEAASKPVVPKAAIGFNYGDNPNVPLASALSTVNNSSIAEDEELDSEDDLDVDLTVSNLNSSQNEQLCRLSYQYCMKKSDFVRLLQADKVLENEFRLAKALEDEKNSVSSTPAFV
ncbi:hypothetical protein Ciccas_004809 [Cichlidogyrus casuarinus]|uniref:Suppressor of white apricot N-terminal domain-containing protein n=1 Tax=Cichlidogyrus casuarinus TaxID=1844966 RepID=A0ABD2QAJ6_9PLAT